MSSQSTTDRQTRKSRLLVMRQFLPLLGFRWAWLNNGAGGQRVLPQPESENIMVLLGAHAGGRLRKADFDAAMAGLVDAGRAMVGQMAVLEQTKFWKCVAEACPWSKAPEGADDDVADLDGAAASAFIIKAIEARNKFVNETDAKKVHTAGEHQGKLATAIDKYEALLQCHSFVTGDVPNFDSAASLFGVATQSGLAAEWVQDDPEPEVGSYGFDFSEMGEMEEEMEMEMEEMEEEEEEAEAEEEAITAPMEAMALDEDDEMMETE